MKDMWVITGAIEDLKDYARQLDRTLMKSVDDRDVDINSLRDVAEKALETVEILVDELDD